MTSTDDAIRANRVHWDARVPLHVASTAYGVERYLSDPAHLSGVVGADARHLGELAGLRVAHVQCHIGTDTLSLARLGAAEVVGIDFSPAALDAARQLSARAVGGERVRFVEAAVDDIPSLGLGGFDLVYTSVGAISWLPSIERWAQIVAGMLVPGGRLYLRDGHPVLGTLDEHDADQRLVIRYPYFEAAGARRWEEHDTYTDVPEGARVSEPVNYDWGHGLAETVQAVLDAGLTLTRLHEGTAVDWPALPWMREEPAGSGRYHLPEEQRLLVPLEFTLEAVRPPVA